MVSEVDEVLTWARESQVETMLMEQERMIAMPCRLRSSPATMDDQDALSLRLVLGLSTTMLQLLPS